MTNPEVGIGGAEAGVGGLFLVPYDELGGAGRFWEVIATEFFFLFSSSWIIAAALIDFQVKIQVLLFVNFERIID